MAVEAPGTVNIAGTQALALVDDFTECNALHIGTEATVRPARTASLGVAKRRSQVFRQVDSWTVHRTVGLKFGVAVIF